MGLLVILIGVILWIFVSSLLGLLCVIAGLILLFIPGIPYGYSSWRGRRGPPP